MLQAKLNDIVNLNIGKGGRKNYNLFLREFIAYLLGEYVIGVLDCNEIDDELQKRSLDLLLESIKKYGLKCGITKTDFESNYVNITGNTRLEYSTAPETLGTGSEVNLVNSITNEVLQTYTVVIYGDVTGDGNIDSIDAGNMVDYENYMTTWDPILDAALIEAGDLNGDGSIDSIDAGIAVDVENYMVTLSQSTGMVVPN